MEEGSVRLINAAETLCPFWIQSSSQLSLSKEAVCESSTGLLQGTDQPRLLLLAALTGRKRVRGGTDTRNQLYPCLSRAPPPTVL